MDDPRSPLTPEQLLLLQQLRLMADLPPGALSVGSQYGPGSLFASSVEGDRSRLMMGGGGVRVPFEGGAVRGNVNAMTMSRPGMDVTSILPTAGLQLGPISGDYGVMYSNGDRTGQVYRGGAQIGGAQLGVSRSASDRGPATTSYSVSAPVGNGSVGAGMMSGAGLPRRYSANAAIPGLLGGDLSVSGEYTPETRDSAVYARWMRRF